MADYARTARQLGFGCFILDDGWMYEADQRVCGDYQVFRTASGNEQILAAFSRFPVNVGPFRKTLLINAGSSGSLTVQATAKAGVAVEDMDGRAVSKPSTIGAGFSAIPCAPGSVLRIEQGS